nr:MAG TPA: hypothetical protein [Caudoviricetes sp.]
MTFESVFLYIRITFTLKNSFLKKFYFHFSFSNKFEYFLEFSLKRRSQENSKSTGFQTTSLEK